MFFSRKIHFSPWEVSTHLFCNDTLILLTQTFTQQDDFLFYEAMKLTYVFLRGRSALIRLEAARRENMRRFLGLWLE